MKTLLNFKKASFLAVCLTYLLVVLLLSGCGNRVQIHHISKAIELCKGNDGLKQLNIFLRDNVVCNNGAVFTREKWMLKDGN